MTNTKQFVWFETYTNAIEKCPDIVAKSMLALAIVEYGALGKEPEFIDTKHTEKWVLESIFEACRVNIDKSRESYEAGKKGAKHGYKGGRPRKGETPEEARARREAESLAIECAAQLPYGNLPLDWDENGDFC